MFFIIISYFEDNFCKNFRFLECFSILGAQGEVVTNISDFAVGGLRAWEVHM